MLRVTVLSTGLMCRKILLPGTGNTQAQANVAHLAETARAHAQAGHWMFFTRDTHQDNYLTTREGRSLPIEHCIEGEDGWNFAPELENVMADTEPEVCHIVDKPTFGSYMLPSEILDELMAHNKAVEDIEKIVIYGYCTDICVISNAWYCVQLSRKQRSKFCRTAAPG